MTRFSFSGFLLSCALAAAPHAARAAEPVDAVNIYSYRQAFLVEPLFDLFRERTGIHVNVLYAKRGLIERIALEGTISPADVLLTTDLSQMLQAADGIAQRVESPVIDRNLPSSARDPEGQWFALTRRVRAVMVARERVSSRETRRMTYESLAQEKWQKRICIRDGYNPYNLAFFGAMLFHKGFSETRLFLEGLKKNLARRPAGNDRAQIRAVAAGACDLAIANSYYLGHMLAKPEEDPQREAARKVRIVFPVFKGGGSHENFSGMVMPRHAPNPILAKWFMEFLTTREAQKIYAETNYEYPIRSDVAASSQIARWPRLRSDRINIREISRKARQAALILDEISFND